MSYLKVTIKGQLIFKNNIFKKVIFKNKADLNKL